MNIAMQQQIHQNIFFSHMDRKYTSTLIDINLLKPREYDDLSKDPVLNPKLNEQRLHTIFPIVVQKVGDVYWIRDGCRRTKRAYDLGHKEVTAYVLNKDDKYYDKSYES